MPCEYRCRRRKRSSDVRPRASPSTRYSCAISLPRERTARLGGHTSGSRHGLRDTSAPDEFSVWQTNHVPRARTLSTCQPAARKSGRQSRVQEIIRPDPSPNSRQHERGLNWRTRRIRTRNPGVRAEPWGFGPHLEPIILETENGPKPQEATESWGFPTTGAATMASTKSRLEIGTDLRQLFQPSVAVPGRIHFGAGAGNRPTAIQPFETIHHPCEILGDGQILRASSRKVRTPHSPWYTGDRSPARNSSLSLRASTRSFLLDPG
jgi:hypothetical protein